MLLEGVGLLGPHVYLAYYKYSILKDSHLVQRAKMFPDNMASLAASIIGVLVAYIYRESVVGCRPTDMGLLERQGNEFWCM